MNETSKDHFSERAAGLTRVVFVRTTRRTFIAVAAGVGSGRKAPSLGRRMRIRASSRPVGDEVDRVKPTDASRETDRPGPNGRKRARRGYRAEPAGEVLSGDHFRRT